MWVTTGVACVTSFRPCEHAGIFILRDLILARPSVLAVCLVSSCQARAFHLTAMVYIFALETDEQLSWVRQSQVSIVSLVKQSKRVLVLVHPETVRPGKSHWRRLCKGLAFLLLSCLLSLCCAVLCPSVPRTL